MGDPRPNRSANRLFRRWSRFALISESGREKLDQKTGDREHDRGHDQKICRSDVFNKMLGNIGAEDGAERPTDCDESV